MRTLAHVALAFTVAIVVSVSLRFYTLFLPLALGFTLITALFFVFFRHKKRFSIPMVTLGLAIGFLWMAIYPSITYAHGASLDTGEAIPFTATLMDTPYEGDDWWALSISVHLEEGNLDATLWLYDLTEDISIGDTLSGYAVFTFSDPYEVDALTYDMVTNSTFLSASLVGDLMVSTPDTLPLSVWAAALSETIATHLLMVYPESTGSLAVALLTGNTSFMEDTLYAAFQRTGVSHIVAVSGMHISFLAGLLALLLGNRGSRFTFVITIAIFFSFAAVAGNSPSVLRAVFLQAFLLLAPLLRRENDKITSLSTALMILLLINPFAIASVSLQLSFGAVAGIYLITSPLYNHWNATLPSRPKKLFLKIKRVVLSFVYGTLATTFGALLLTVPIVAYHFNTVSFLAPLTNLLTLWAVSDAFLGGMLVAVVTFLSLPFATIFAWVASLFLQYLTFVVSALSTIPFGAATTENIYILLWMVLTYVLLLVFGYQKYKGYPTTPLPLCISGVFLTLVLLLTAFQGYSGDMRITVLDVGQGQSILVTSGGSTMLVDCGGDDSAEAGTAAADQIYALGTSHLDLLVLTHCHDDHAGGVETLLSKVSVGAIILPESANPLDLELELLALAEDYDIPVLTLSEVATVTLGDATVTLFPPVLNEDANEEGLFVLCSTPEFDMLVTGDVGQMAELLLIKNYDIPDLELLVVGHHGSSYSTSQLLLDATTPEYAVISVGENNSYGHPADDVLSRLTDIGSTIYRTDQLGTITITVN